MIESQLMKRIFESYRSRDFASAEEMILEACNSKMVGYRLARLCQSVYAELQSAADERHKLLAKRTISVITINFNNLAGLRRTVESVLTQTCRDDLQFIVVDGDSKDGSIEYLKSMSKELDLVVYGRDAGIYDAMNRGCEFVHSDYTIFMNSGDCFDHAGVVEELLPIMRSEPLFDLIFGKTRRENGSVWGTHPVEDLWKGMVCSHQSIFFRSARLGDAPYDTENSVVGDFDLIYRWFLEGARFSEVDAVIAHIEAPGVSGDFKSRTIQRWSVVRENLPPGKSRQDVDMFYESLLKTDGNVKGGAHGHRPDPSQYDLINNVQERVVFLISMPRSGSTMLQRILECSPEISSVGEPWVMLPIASAYNEEMIEAKYSQRLNVLAGREFISDIGIPDIVTNAQQMYADALYSRILKKLKTRMFLDKTPRYVHIVEELSKFYPRAKFIVLLRNPAAVISSYAQTWFNGSFAKVLGDQYCRYDIAKGFSRLADFATSRFGNKFVVRYEDLVERPEDVGRRLFAYLGLRFDPAFLNYGGAQRPLKKYKFGDPNSVYSKERPDPSGNTKWLRQVSESGDRDGFVEAIDLIDGEVVTRLGYSKAEILAAVKGEAASARPLVQVIEERHGSNDSLLEPSGKLRQTRGGAVACRKSIGVLITSFNSRRTIEQAIRSVVTQSRKPDLVVVADDCSDDGTAEIVREIAKGEPVIRLIRREKNVGVAANRDLAIAEMDTAYVTTLDGDDLFFPGKLELEFLALNGRLDAVAYSDIVVLRPEGSVRQSTVGYAGKSARRMLEMAAGRQAPVPRDMMFSRDLFDKAEGFDKELAIYEDWAFKMRLMMRSADEGWLHTGGIGTVYDRRAPGLSKRPPIVHAYGQLRVIGRNRGIFGNEPTALILGLRTVAAHLRENMKERLERVINVAERDVEKCAELMPRLEEIWITGANGMSDREMYDAMWRFARPI